MLLTKIIIIYIQFFKIKLTKFCFEKIFIKFYKTLNFYFTYPKKTFINYLKRFFINLARAKLDLQKYLIAKKLILVMKLF